jgi:hypothetical protein
MASAQWQEADLDDEELDQYAPLQAKDDRTTSHPEYTPEQEAEIKAFAQDFYGDVKALAKQYMEQFFKDKMLHCGGKIPRSFLFAERRISMVMNYDIIKGVERAYKSLEKAMSVAADVAKQGGEVTDDIKLVNETLNLLARSGIPQQFAGGMMCLYLEFIEGVDIGTAP